MNWLTYGSVDAQTVNNGELLIQIVDDVLNENRSADPDRVYLIGFSMGGQGAWHLAAKSPGWFAAVVPISGGGDPSTAASLVDLPIWAVHGSNDEVVPIDSTRRMITAIQTAGGNPRFLELAGRGHAAWKPAFQDSDLLLRWLFQQSKVDNVNRANQTKHEIE